MTPKNIPCSWMRFGTSLWEMIWCRRCLLTTTNSMSGEPNEWFTPMSSFRHLKLESLEAAFEDKGQTKKTCFLEKRKKKKKILIKSTDHWTILTAVTIKIRFSQECPAYSNIRTSAVINPENLTSRSNISKADRSSSTVRLLVTKLSSSSETPWTLPAL